MTRSNCSLQKFAPKVPKDAPKAMETYSTIRPIFRRGSQTKFEPVRARVYHWCRCLKCCDGGWRQWCSCGEGRKHNEKGETTAVKVSPKTATEHNIRWRRKNVIARLHHYSNIFSCEEWMPPGYFFRNESGAVCEGLRVGMVGAQFKPGIMG